MSALISVIVPIYKVEQYMEQCVSSIHNQTYRNLEIILVDDGSPDNCPHMCDEWTHKDPRIRVIHKKNGGLSSARNAGIDIAKGEYMAFIDSDDYIDAKYIEKLYAAIIENDSDLAVCGYVKIDEENRVYSAIDSDVWGGYITSGNDVIIRMIEARLNQQLFSDKADFIVAWNKLYKASLWKELRYPVGKINEDEYVNFDLLGGCNSIIIIPDSLYYYRQRDSSIMSLDKLVTQNNKYSIRMDDIWHKRMLYAYGHGIENYAKQLAEQEYSRIASTIFHFASYMTNEEAKQYAKMLAQARDIQSPLMLKSLKDKFKWKLIELFPSYYCMIKRLLIYKK